jgi:ribosomal protein L31
MPIFSFKRTIQSLVHPQKFIRLLKLTDGSMIRVSTLSPPPISTSNAEYSVSLMNLDSANHPSWNPELRDRLLLDDRGQVAKFRAKFEKKQITELSPEALSTDYADFLQMDPTLNITETGNQLTKVKVKIPIKNAAKKKK